jgi:antitoxin (DNA-binding transcriptional repressor) of toxin-antitoxin stability system
MKTVDADLSTLDLCIGAAQNERVIVTRAGKPIAIVVGIEGLDQEQLELASNSEFWQLIEQRRRQPTISRDELERRLGNS